MTGEVKLALGRLFSMMMRPEEPGDAEMYARIRGLVLDASEVPQDTRPDIGRDRGRGAQGQW